MSAAPTATAAAVPFLDLEPAYSALNEAIVREIRDLLASAAFTNGPQVQEFESAFASFCGTSHCVGVASGLDALRLALQGAGLEPGDEVILPANTFVATAEAVSQAGGMPVLVDATEADYNIDVDGVAAAIGPMTRFVLPVHLYGQLADMRSLHELASRHDLMIIEDACQAHGAERDGVRAGGRGLAGAFSFYPGKNLGAIGDAGALVTNSEALADRVRALREHGQHAKYQHDWIGWTSRLDTIQAIALLRRLPGLTRWNAERRSAADQYLAELRDVGDLVLPTVAAGSKHVWHLFVVQTAAPEALQSHLQARGIGTGRHYPQPIHLTAAYQMLGFTDGAFPVSERLADRCLSLPMFPGITEAQVQSVCSAVRAFFAARG